MLAWLRIVVSCFCLVLCVLLAALWVRSYWNVDWLTRVRHNEGRMVAQRHIAASGLGSTALYFYSKSMHGTIERRSRPFDFTLQMPVGWPKSGFGWQTQVRTSGTVRTLYLPHWLPALATALLAIAIRPKPRWRYGTRDLFTLSTVAAVTVGILAVVLRAIGG